MASMASSASVTSAMSGEPAGAESEGPKFFFQPRYATFVVKGNFMTLAAQPKHVDLGEWLAHQSKRAELRLSMDHT